MESDLISNFVKSYLKSELLECFLLWSVEKVCDNIILKEKIQQHSNSVIEWSKIINLKDMPDIKNIRDVYIHLDLYIYPKSGRIEDNETITKIKLIEHLKNFSHNMIILGPPGSGKTTSIKYFVHAETKKKSVLLILIRRIDFSEKPDSIVFRNINDVLGLNEYNIMYESLYEKIKEKIREKNIEIDIRSQELQRMQKKLLSIINNKAINENEKRIRDEQNEIKDLEDGYHSFRRENENKICKIIDKKYKYVIIEGVDEAPSEVFTKKIFEEISALSWELKNTRLIVTTRTGIIINCHNEKIRQYEIAPLDMEQKTMFVKK
jgi:signal recognition particle GTPase